MCITNIRKLFINCHDTLVNGYKVFFETTRQMASCISSKCIHEILTSKIIFQVLLVEMKHVGFAILQLLPGTVKFNATEKMPCPNIYS